MSKNKQFLVYLVSNHSETSITSLMKLAYLVDLISVGKNAKQISSYEYIRYFYGPYCKDISTDLEDLLKNGVIKSESKYLGSVAECVIFEKNEDIDFNKLDEEEKEVINGSLSEFNGYGAKVLTEVAYKTKPMVALNATLGGKENLNKKLNLFTE